MKKILLILLIIISSVLAKAQTKNILKSYNYHEKGYFFLIGEGLFFQPSYQSANPLESLLADGGFMIIDRPSNKIFLPDKTIGFSIKEITLYDSEFKTLLTYDSISYFYGNILMNVFYQNQLDSLPYHLEGTKFEISYKNKTYNLGGSMLNGNLLDIEPMDNQIRQSYLSYLRSKQYTPIWGKNKN